MEQKNQITYRRPTFDEAEAFAALHVQCWREAYAEIVPPALLATFSTKTRLPMWQAVLANPQRFVLGAYAEGNPAGFIISGATEDKHIENQDGDIASLYIAASQHRKGIGRTLIGRAATDWLAQGGTSLTIGVLTENYSARRFYEEVGAKLVRQCTYNWGGFELHDCIYLLTDLAKFAKV